MDLSALHLEAATVRTRQDGNAVVFQILESRLFARMGDGPGHDGTFQSLTVHLAGHVLPSTFHHVAGPDRLGHPELVAITEVQKPNNRQGHQDRNEAETSLGLHLGIHFHKRIYHTFIVTFQLSPQS